MRSLEDILKSPPPLEIVILEKDIYKFINIKTIKNKLVKFNIA